MTCSKLKTMFDIQYQQPLLTAQPTPCLQFLLDTQTTCLISTISPTSTIQVQVQTQHRISLAPSCEMSRSAIIISTMHNQTTLIIFLLDLQTNTISSESDAIQWREKGDSVYREHLKQALTVCQSYPAQLQIMMMTTRVVDQLMKFVPSPWRPALIQRREIHQSMTCCISSHINLHSPTTALCRSHAQFYQQ